MLKVLVLSKDKNLEGVAAFLATRLEFKVIFAMTDEFAEVDPESFDCVAAEVDNPSAQDSLRNLLQESEKPFMLFGNFDGQSEDVQQNIAKAIERVKQITTA